MANVRPVCLPTGHQKYAGELGTVIGWGSLKENGPQPNQLMEVTVKIWDNPTCKDTYGNAAPGGIMDHMLCAGQKGKDSCSVSLNSFFYVFHYYTKRMEIEKYSHFREILVAPCKLDQVKHGPRLVLLVGELGAVNLTTLGCTQESPSSETGSTE